MLSNDEGSGIFGWLAGLVIIVMIGVGLSLMVDRRFQFSSNNKESRSIIEKDAVYLSDLKERQTKEREKFDRLDGPRRLASRELDELKLRLPVAQSRIRELKEAIASRKSEIAAQEKSMDGYRRSYRDQTWRLAIGEKHPTILLKTGKSYEAATISRVTPVGLEISHKDGLARIDFTELDKSWMERFQWQFDERELTIAGEQAAAAAPAVSDKTEVRPEPSSDDSGATLERLRTDVANWNSRVAILKGDYAEAAMNARTNRTSVTGGLETWAAKAERLSKELAKAKDSRDRARIRLGTVAPDDPLAKAPVAVD